MPRPPASRASGGRNPYGGSRAAAAPDSDSVVLTVEPGEALVARLREALRNAADAPHFVIHTDASANNPPPLGEGRVGAAVTVVVVPVSDTCKEVIDGLVRATIPRESLVVARGPWLFTRDALADVLDRVAARETQIHDMTGLCEAAGERVRVLAAQ